MSLNSVFKADLYSVQKATGPTGEIWVKAFIGVPADPNDTTTKGLSLMSISAEPNVFDGLNIKTFPHSCEIECSMVRGGANKMKQHVVAIRPIGGERPQPAAKA